MYFWVDLRDKIMTNFKGFANESLTASNLFQCKQKQGESLKRYVHLKARAPNVPEEVAIKASSRALH
jgi:hypothetical protein